MQIMAETGPPPSNNNNRGPEILITFSSTLGIALILLCLRLYVRARIVRKLWWDDLFIAFSFVSMMKAYSYVAYSKIRWCRMQLFAVIGLLFLAISISAGLGRHAFYLTLDQLEKALKWLDIGQVMLVISPMLTKISISLFLLRLFQIKKVYSWT